MGNALKVLKENWKTNLILAGSFIFTSTVLIFSFAMLGESIYNLMVDHNHISIDIFQAFTGSFVSCVLFAFYFANRTQLKTQDTMVTKMKTIGFSKSKVRNLIFLEKLIVLIPSFLVGVGIAAIIMSSFMSKVGAIGAFQYNAPLNLDVAMIAAGSVVTLLILIIMTTISIADVVRGRNNFVSPKKRLVRKIISHLVRLGLIAGIGGIIVAISSDPESTDADTFPPIFMFVGFAICLAMGWIVSPLIKLVTILSRRNPSSFVLYSSISNNYGKFGASTYLFIIAYIFLFIQYGYSGMYISSSDLAEDRLSKLINMFTFTFFVVYITFVGMSIISIRLDEKVKENKNLLKIGFTNSQIIRMNFKEAIVLTIITFAFGYVTGIVGAYFAKARTGMPFNEIINKSALIWIPVLMTTLIFSLYIIYSIPFIKNKSRNKSKPHPIFGYLNLPTKR